MKKHKITIKLKEKQAKKLLKCVEVGTKIDKHELRKMLRDYEVWCFTLPKGGEVLFSTAGTKIDYYLDKIYDPRII